MQVVYHGESPIGFPPSANNVVEGVVLFPKVAKELSKEWFETFKKHPQVKVLFMKGSHGGLEVLGDHEGALKGLYSNDMPSKEARLEDYMKEIQAAAQFAQNRLKSEPSTRGAGR
jgi:hypothetical protein